MLKTNLNVIKPLLPFMRIPKGQSKMANLEKLGTRQRKTEQKHNTLCVGHHYMQTSTNNVNKA
jgi:hypothetical protein